jgi:hypothetical protein
MLESGPMSFHVASLNLVVAVSDAMREIGDELFSGPKPQFLHHYTSAATVEKIVLSRSLWATCIHDQTDKTEISHTSGLVTQLVGEIARSAIPEFAADVIARLPFFMEERKQWIFIACFCDDYDSPLYWTGYGDYCLRFPAPWIESSFLSIADSKAECWYQRVVYDEELQRRVMERALRSIVSAISHNTSGSNDGPWAQAMIDNCARNAAQLLLSIAVGFKRRSFEGEREWRIVCAPQLGSNNSAPRSIDDYFSSNIIRAPRRHLRLRIHERTPLFSSTVNSPIPFLDWSCNPNRRDQGEIEKINNSLRASDRDDIMRL